MFELQNELDEFIAKIESSKTYREYETKKNELCQQPELKQRVDEYRRRNFELQTKEDHGNLFEEIERFQKENEDLRNIPLVNDFLASELAFCRMVQEITTTIAQAVAEDFD